MLPIRTDRWTALNQEGCGSLPVRYYVTVKTETVQLFTGDPSSVPQDGVSTKVAWERLIETRANVALSERPSFRT